MRLYGFIRLQHLVLHILSGVMSLYMYNPSLSSGAGEEATYLLN